VKNLIATIPDWYSTRVSRLVKRNPGFYKTLGAVISLIGLLCILGGFAWMIILGTTTPPPRMLAVFFAAGFVVGCTNLGAQLYSYSNGCLTLDWDEVLGRDKRCPVLYLRAFSMDNNRSVYSISSVMFGVIYRTSEEYLVRSLDRIGPVVAIGRPGEPVPPPGAHRVYVGDSDWKLAVEHLIETAQLLVFNLRQLSDNLWWELVCATRAKKESTDIILYLPRVWRDDTYGADVYGELREEAFERFGLRFPPYDDRIRLLWINNDGVVLPLPPRTEPWWRRIGRAILDPNKEYYELTTALFPVMRKIGIELGEDYRLPRDTADWIADQTRTVMIVATWLLPLTVLLGCIALGVRSLVSRLF